jgi:hypothetical protein
MKNLLIVCVAVTAVLFGANCGNSDRTPEKLCEKFVGCGAIADQDTCLAGVGSLALSDACIDEMLATSCEEHNSGSASYFDTCFDDCAANGRHCDGDELVICNNGTEFVYDCVRVCRYQTSGSYSGECSAINSNGQISEIGAVCWCQVQ